MPTHYQVDSEFGVLTDVLLSRPDHYRWFASCEVASRSMASGLTLDLNTARAEHTRLALHLEMEGVRCHYVPSSAAAPDLVYTRDTSLVTPWGAIVLRPSATHRLDESERVASHLHSLAVPIAGRISRGGLEGGDICLLKPGTVIVGCSEQRSTLAGAEELAELFAQHGWETIVYPFDAQYLHLDTVLGVLGTDAVLACTDVLDSWLVAALRNRGFRVLEVTLEESRHLACNVLALGAGRVLMSDGTERVREMIGTAGFRPIGIGVDQFTRAGGGIHCLTMPLARTPTRAESLV